MTLGLPSLLPPKELLASVLDEYGEVHVCYRTAELTPCGLTAKELPSSVERRGPEPTCPACVGWARVCDDIDGSAPTHWGWRVEAA